VLVLETWTTPAALTAAGKTKVRTRLLKKAPRLGGRLTDEIFAALAAQTVVVVTGTNAAGIVLPRLAAQFAALRQKRAEVAEQVEELVAAHPLSKVLTTMPGVGVRTCARILHPRSSARTSPPPGTSPPTPVSPRSPADPGPPSAEEHPTPRRQQGPQTSAVPVRVRRPGRPRLSDVLRPANELSRRSTT